MIMETILITWTSGFIWFHLAQQLLARGNKVLGIDNENDYYDVSLKQARRKELEQHPYFTHYHFDFADNDALRKVFEDNSIDKVANIAAQAGVRYGFINPHAYIQTNVVGFHNLIDLAKKHACSNFVYASTGSVYGENAWWVGSIGDACESPLSIYAATKKTDELIAHAYSHLYGMQTIGLRFFNVYWPWWRPDSAYYIFTKNILEGKPIKIHNHGNMWRNNTYVDDIVDWIILALEYNNWGKYELFNLWNEKLVPLMDFVQCIEKKLWCTAEKEFIDIQPWEIEWSSVNSAKTKEILWRNTHTEVQEWIDNFVDRYRSFYKI